MAVSTSQLARTQLVKKYWSPWTAKTHCMWRHAIICFSKTVHAWLWRFAMQVGKNKRISKSKKGGKKKAQDPFARKDWYDVKAPSMFSRRSVGKTLVTRTTGTKVKHPRLSCNLIFLLLFFHQQTFSCTSSFVTMQVRARSTVARLNWQRLHCEYDGGQIF